MNRSARAAFLGSAMVAAVVMFGTPLAAAPNGSIWAQCPGDTNGDAIPDAIPDVNGVAGTWNGDPIRTTTLLPGGPTVYYIDHNKSTKLDGDEGPVHCMHLAAGDGYITMADGKPIYSFGFSNVTGLEPSDVVNGNGTRPGGLAAANYPAPTIELTEGEEFFLSLTNVGMILRPDLFDPHSVHFHGFPQAASVFDGVPESSATINMGSTFTYYYKIVDGLAGTYMYHCHVEATEHIQMGMVGNLYIHPRGGAKVAYNDGDGSTAYDKEYPIQLGSLDPNFHDQHIAIQPLPFAAMDDKYPLLNGRGYPDTVDPGVISTDSPAGVGILPSQPVSSRIEASAGEKVLLRLSNLAVTRFYTLGSTIPMHVVGHNAKLLRGPAPDASHPGRNLYYDTNSVTLGGGESVDVILDTTGVAPGTYLLYTTNLNYLSNDGEDFGGMMTEITITGTGTGG